MNSKQKLRTLFQGTKLIRLAGAHHALGAKLAAQAGFDGVWSSGLEISAAHALPDANILTMSDYLAAAESMATAVNIPIVADCDTGYGNSNNVIHAVQKFEAAGVAAICIEDKLFPKVNSFIPGRQELAPIAEFVGKIMAAKNAQRDPDFMVIARVEALIAGWGEAEALKRAYAYQDAGADAILIHNKTRSPQPIIDFVKAWEGHAPLVVVPTTYYSITGRELEALGIKMAIYANQGLRASIQALSETYAEILATDSAESILPNIVPLKTVFALQGMAQFKQNEADYVRKGEKTRAIIPAAGAPRDTSLHAITSDLPVTMLDLNGKPLLQRQLEHLNQTGIHDVTVIAGYQGDKINVDGVTKVENERWQNSADFYSLLCAPNSYDGYTLIVYGDILFDTDAIHKLCKSEHDITLLIDRTHTRKNYAPNRLIDLVITTRTTPDSHRILNLQGSDSVQKIGMYVEPKEADGEFTGLARLSPKGFQTLFDIYTDIQNRVPDTSFHEAKNIQSASLTDMIQEAIGRGHTVACLEISSGWMEIHTFADYKFASKLTSA